MQHVRFITGIRTGENKMDETEGTRRTLMEIINANPPDDRALLEKEVGQVWDTGEVEQEFEVLAFIAPFVVVRRRSDGVKGTLVFQHSPRLYYSFKVHA